MRFSHKAFAALFPTMLIIGVFLLLISNNVFSFSSVVPVTSIAPEQGNGSLGASITSTSPDHPILASIFNLTSGSGYKWTMTVTNTGSVAWSGAQITVRIATLVAEPEVSGVPYAAISSTNNLQQFQSLFGQDTFGQGVIQVCYNPAASSVQQGINNCLVRLDGGAPDTQLGESWLLSQSSTGSGTFSPDGTVAVIVIPQTVNPGQSITVSFDASIPAFNSSDFGTYYALENLVVHSSSVNGADLVDYNVVPINVTSGLSGGLTTNGIESIAGVGLSILGILGLLLRRRL